MLKVTDLHAAIDGKEILKGLSLDVPAGEVHAIMGPNGAGKSTLSYVLTGRDGYEVTQGSVTLDGEDLLALAPDERAARGVFLSFQYPLEIPGVPALTFIRTALNAQRRARGEDEIAAPAFLKLAREKAAALKIDFDMLKRALNVGFSGGEKKRMEILQMAMLSPRFLILDETDSGLDIDALRIVADGVNALRDPSRAMLIITHYQRLLDYIKPDRVHVLAGGRIVASGGPELARELDVAQLPSRRDEDWRWTDLRGLIRALPDPSASFEGDLGPGPFDALTENRRAVINGGEADFQAKAGEKALISLRISARGAGSHANRVHISVGAGAYLWLLESYDSDDASVAQTSLTIDVAEGAGVERIVLASDHPEAVSVSQADVRLAPRAEFAQTILTSGARRQRIETRVAHPGGHAKLRADGAYILSNKSHADLTSVVTHQGTDGLTEQLTKGVVRDQARGVFQGRIVVTEGADRTDARMGHHALILSDRAEVDAKPELEIYADDVA